MKKNIVDKNGMNVNLNTFVNPEFMKNKVDLFLKKKIIKSTACFLCPFIIVCHVTLWPRAPICIMNCKSLEFVREKDEKKKHVAGVGARGEKGDI